jgi:hypothetical protein
MVSSLDIGSLSVQDPEAIDPDRCQNTLQDEFITSPLFAPSSDERKEDSQLVHRKIKCPNCKESLESEEVNIWASRGDSKAFAGGYAFFEGENEFDGGVEVPSQFRRIWSLDL